MTLYHTLLYISRRWNNLLSKPILVSSSPRISASCFILTLAIYTFPLAAQQRTLLDFGHLDIDWAYAAGEWSAKTVWDEVFPPLELSPEQAVLVAKDEPYPDEGSRSTRPAGSEWNFIGVNAGENIWILPAFANENPILEPGFSTYGVPSGPGGVRINLADFRFHGDGIGHMSVYTRNTFTNTNIVHMTTSDGIDSNDVYNLDRDDHRHMNWVFTQKGVYEVSLIASMLTVANDEDSRVTSDPQTFIFAIGAPHMELWLLEHGVAPAKLGETDTPADDGVANLLKYALNLPPLQPIPSIAVPTFLNVGGEDYLALDLALNPHAQDLDVSVQTSQDLVSWHSGNGHTVTLEESSSRIHVRDAFAKGPATRRFIRLAVERNLPGNDD